MTFKQTVEKILKTEEMFLDTETKELNYTKVKDSADKIDPKLIVLLADHKETKEKFFTKIKDVYVFNINDFKFFRYWLRHGLASSLEAILLRDVLI